MVCIEEQEPNIAPLCSGGKLGSDRVIEVSERWNWASPAFERLACPPINSRFGETGSLLGQASPDGIVIEEHLTIGRVK